MKYLMTITLTPTHEGKHFKLRYYKPIVGKTANGQIEKLITGDHAAQTTSC